MMVRLKFAALAIALVAVTGNSAKADELWYDGFDTTSDYTLGAIAGQSGGTGSFFTGPYVEAFGGSSHSVAAASLTRPGQINPSIGGSTVSGATDGCCILNRTGRLMSTPWGGFDDPDETFYMSFFAGFGTGTIHARVLEMWDGSLDDGQRNLQFGFSEFDNMGGPGTMMGLRVRDSFDNVFETDQLSENVNINLDQNTTHFVVLKFEMSTSAPDVISAFLDPVGTTEPGTPSAQVTIDEFHIDRVGLISTFVFGPGTATSLDELRVSDNSDGMGFADVANNTLAYQPIPEPATLGLVGLAVLGLLTVGRKRS